MESKGEKKLVRGNAGNLKSAHNTRNVYTRVMNYIILKIKDIAFFLWRNFLAYLKTVSHIT